MFYNKSKYTISFSKISQIIFPFKQEIKNQIDVLTFDRFSIVIL